MIFLFVPSVAAAGTAGGAPGANEKIRVIASILPQAEFIEKVGAGRADLDIMVPKGMDPHTYEPVPSQLKKAAAAVLYFKLGSGVEFELAWMDRITSLNKDLAVVDTSRGAELIEGDPHAWLSPKNAAIMVNNIRDAFIMKDPAHKDIYEENAEKYIKELSALDAEIAHKLAGRRNRVFMVFHPAWSYFARDYNLREIAIQAEGKEPTIKGMKKALDEARANNVKVILVSPQFSRQSAETAAKEINGTVALADPLARDYADNVRRVADILAEEAD